jgi:hypothetical protein
LALAQLVDAELVEQMHQVARDGARIALVVQQLVHER